MSGPEQMDTGLMAGLLGRFPPHDAPILPDGAEDGLPPDQPRRLAVVLAYDGEAFAGWQLQPRGRTLQGEMEAALSRLCDEPVRVEASGRTDAGVHALGQVASFSTMSRLSLIRMRRGLASLLPPAMHLRALGPTPPEFHARFDAQGKTYLYHLWPGAQAPLFLRRRVWALRDDLDLAAMNQALAAVSGEVDLRALATRLPAGEEDTVRHIREAVLEADGPLVCFRITGSGFLRHVVRNLVGILVQVGQGRLAPEALGEMLAAGSRLYAGPKAPAGGLYLARVYYSPPPEG